jgi:putative selenium metabolism hydrolase
MRPYQVDAESVADFAFRLIAQPSLSGHEEEVAQIITRELDRLGFETVTDELGNVIGTIDAGPGPVVMLDSHMDTVGVSDPRAWSRDPWGERVGDRLYGRGAVDMKGPLAASVYGAHAAAAHLRRGRVIVATTVAEELVEGPALVHAAERAGPDWVVICEATGLRLARGQRGRAEVRIDVRGRPTHTSKPEFGVNAAEAMADIIGALRALPRPAHARLGAGITVLTDVKSFPYPGLSVVPDQCVATYDRRTLPGETADDVLAPIRSLVEETLAGGDATATVSIGTDEFDTYTGRRMVEPNFAPAWFFEEDAPVVRAAVNGLSRAGVEPVVGHYSFCTNGSGTTGRLGIPTVGFGPGAEELAHRVDEHTDLESLHAGARGYAGMIHEFTETPPAHG